MVDHFKNIRKFDFPLNRYDNDPFLKNPLMKFRIKTTKRTKHKRGKTKIVSMKWDFILLIVDFI